MRKFFLASLFFLAIVLLGAGAALAASVDVKLTCPINVKHGTVLNVTAVFQNWDCVNPYKIKGYMKGLAGNASLTSAAAGGTLGGLGLWGPFFTNLTAAPWTVPHANCTTNIPGTLTQTIAVISATPASLTGTAAVASVAVMNQGNPDGGGECFVNVQ